MIEVFPIGQKVNLGDQMTGVILEICIKSSGESYRVVWWDGKARKAEWLESTEISPVGVPTKTTLGFGRGEL